MAERLPEQTRELAIALRREGHTYREIAGSLGISIGTCSLWLRDLPAPSRDGYDQERVAAMWRKRWEPHHRERERERRETKLAACRDVGDLSEREILLAGALVYWCEGAKDKTYRRYEHVTFVNSDAALVTFFLRFLRVAGVPPGDLRFRLHIHETAEVTEATRFWAGLVRASPETFQKPVIKRHKPRTSRRNLVEDYRGCLVVTVLRSAGLYRRIEGWAHGAMLGEREASDRLAGRSEASLARLADERGGPAK